MDFLPNSTKIQVCVVFNGLQCGVNDLAMNTINFLGITQYFNNKVFTLVAGMYRQPEFLRATYHSPKKFTNVKMFASSPWGTPAKAELESYVFRPDA